MHLESIADNARDVDFAMRWGFGMKQGPFELWQDAGWQQVAEWVKADIDAGKALCAAPLPAWVFDGRSGRAHAGRLVEPVAARRMCRAAAAGVLAPALPREPCSARARADPLKSGTEVFKNDEIRLWTLDGQVLIASITAKMHLIGPGVIEGLLKAVELAEAGTRVW